MAEAIVCGRGGGKGGLTGTTRYDYSFASYYYYCYIIYLLHPSSATPTKGWQAAATSNMKSQNWAAGAHTIYHIIYHQSPASTNTNSTKPHKSTAIIHPESNIHALPSPHPRRENHTKGIYIPPQKAPVVHMHPMQGTVRCTPQ